MNLRCKKPRPLTREDKTYRDDRLFIVATEDTYAPRQYFEALCNPRIKVHVLQTDGGMSAPGHVVRRLDDFIKEYSTIAEDEFWLVLDTDHWVEPNHIANFKQICAEAAHKRYSMAHSNPCFEVWLLLHVAELRETDQFCRCDQVVNRLRDILGTFNKRNIDMQRFPIKDVRRAIERAEKLDGGRNDRWPQRTGSHLYRLVRKLLPDFNEPM